MSISIFAFAFHSVWSIGYGHSNLVFIQICFVSHCHLPFTFSFYTCGSYNVYVLHFPHPTPSSFHLRSACVFHFVCLPRTSKVVRLYGFPIILPLTFVLGHFVLGYCPALFPLSFRLNIVFAHRLPLGAVLGCESTFKYPVYIYYISYIHIFSSFIIPTFLDT